METKGSIEHSGRVQRVEKGRVWVAIVSNSACGSCRARQACGVSESAEKIIEVETSSSSDFEVGEEVVVSVRSKAGMRAVVFAYVLPLAVLVAVLTAVKAAGGEDGPAALASLGGVATYYLLLWVFRRRMAESVRFAVRKK